MRRRLIFLRTSDDERWTEHRLDHTPSVASPLMRVSLMKRTKGTWNARFRSVFLWPPLLCIYMHIFNFITEFILFFNLIYLTDVSIIRVTMIYLVDARFLFLLASMQQSVYPQPTTHRQQKHKKCAVILLFYCIWNLKLTYSHCHCHSRSSHSRSSHSRSSHSRSSHSCSSHRRSRKSHCRG
jgi:hypothetical protein